MQSEQKDLIRKYWNKLIQLSEVQSFAKTLIARNIFTQSQITHIFSSHDERINRERFFDEIQDKDETYDLLVEWLNATNNKLALKLAIRRSGITPFPSAEPEENDVESEGEDEITSSIEAEIPITFDDTRTPLKVEVNLASEFRDSKQYNPYMPFYKCRSKNRGRALIINNFNFHGTDHKTRTGAEVDELNVKQLFQQMGGWVIKSYINKTADEMKCILKSFTKEKREKRCDACFVFIMSHGSEKLNETIIYGSDGRYLTTNQIQTYFTNEKCALFRGKPKVFIYQVCRGHELDLPRIYTDFDGKRREPSGQPHQTTCKSTPGYFRPVEDMLIGYATMQGSKAHRDPYRGTWYIELICKHFMELARYESVDNLLVKVDEGLRKRMSEYGTVQTAEHISKGFKKLYLNPGIYEENGKLESASFNMVDVRFSDISASYYPPTLQTGFMGAHPPIKSGSYEPGHTSYFQNFRNEHISRMQMPPQEWGVITSPYTPHPDISIYRKPSKYLKFPQSDISMLDAERQQEVDDFYTACQMHRDQYKDHTGTLHPLDYFKTSDYMYQCPKDPTSVYLKYPEYYTRYKDPLVFPLTLERSYRAPYLPERALTGIYNRSSFVGRQ